MDSFVIRLWSPGEGEDDQLRGTVTHVASGVDATFRSEEELLMFLHQAAGEDRRPG